MMLAQGYTVAGTARQLGLAKSTVQGINQRLTPKERKEWSQQYRTWAQQKLLPQVKEYLMEALPSAKPLQLNNIIGTVGGLMWAVAIFALGTAQPRRKQVQDV